MKKGIVRIVVGLILVCLQIMSVVGNLSAGDSLPVLFGSGTLFAFNLINFLSYYFIGLLGILLWILGFIAYTKSSDIKNMSQCNILSSGEEHEVETTPQTDKALTSDTPREVKSASIESVQKELTPNVPIVSAPFSTNHRKGFLILQILSCLMIAILLIGFLIRDRQLSNQVRDLSDQVTLLQQQNDTLLADYEELSENYNDLSNSTKYLLSSAKFQSHSIEGIDSRISNIATCIAELYHRTGLHTGGSNKLTCFECYLMIYGS